MGVFRRSGHSGKTACAKTVIADGCHIAGQVKLAGDLHLDGSLEGTIEAVQLSVGKQGHLNGIVRAKHVILAGKVEGKIHCELLELLAGCQLNGEVNCHDLVVEKGARFIGSTKDSATAVALEVLAQQPEVALLTQTNSGSEKPV
ncbi:MAG: polymer-forming cytoskeletal protein [Gammaproteobacteria bacterium]|nr:polymer-forming cytoskeletal protein [Gammaproteobacteria bacterium]